MMYFTDGEKVVTVQLLEWDGKDATEEVINPLDYYRTEQSGEVLYSVQNLIELKSIAEKWVHSTQYGREAVITDVTDDFAIKEPNLGELVDTANWFARRRNGTEADEV